MNESKNELFELFMVIAVIAFIVAVANGVFYFISLFSAVLAPFLFCGGVVVWLIYYLYKKITGSKDE
ncbi:hypothetical protein [Campylobacter pinnipediorum]|uniref:hypothetical protein n=1 Tax=Campylobacter pinnipediorum TaxID=1965231 RepID=UPI0009951295|nr:hypothetical protein [Campylobacter pinnipediorum]AQW83012.1 putative membrane protein [Campylobacter pinnipediorum subsp. pinnipediorum]